MLGLRYSFGVALLNALSVVNCAQLTTDRVSSGWLRSALIVWRQISDSQHAGLVEALDIPGGTGGVMPLPNDDIRDAMLMVKRTYRPNFLHRKMRCGWKKRCVCVNLIVAVLKHDSRFVIFLLWVLAYIVIL